MTLHGHIYSTWPHILLNYTEHWLMVVDGEHHPSSSYIDLVVSIIPSRPDLPVDWFDDNNIWYNPLVYIDKCMTCSIKPVDSDAYVTVEHTVIEESNLDGVFQYSVPIIRRYTDAHMVDSIRLTIKNELQCTDKQHKQYDNNLTYNKQNRKFVYRPNHWSTWPAIQQHTLTLPFKYQINQHRLDTTLCIQPLNDQTNELLLQQWIDYHLYIGFDRIFIYDRINLLHNNHGYNHIYLTTLLS